MTLSELIKPIRPNRMTLWRIVKPIIPNRYKPYKVPGGQIFLNISESPMMLARVVGRFEVQKHRAVLALLKPGMTFIDVGANKGDFGLLAAQIVGEKGRVLSFEPEPTNCHWIRKSIELNGYKNIVLYEAALADANEQSRLFLGKQSGWHTLMEAMPNRNCGIIPITKRTLDSVLQETGSNRVDVIKIDVEGAEIAVLRGAVETLKANRDILLLMDIHPDLGVDPFAVCDLLGSLGFSTYEIEPPYRKPLHLHSDTRQLMAKRP
ncbi:MAG: FkbM family methyltransferase [Terriglobales bacterium]